MALPERFEPIRVDDAPSRDRSVEFTPEEKVRIVPEGPRGELRVTELCRRQGIAEAG